MLPRMSLQMTFHPFTFACKITIVIRFVFLIDQIKFENLNFFPVQLRNILYYTGQEFEEQIKKLEHHWNILENEIINKSQIIFSRNVE